MLARCCR